MVPIEISHIAGNGTIIPPIPSIKVIRQAAAQAPWVNRVELMDVLMQATFRNGSDSGPRKKMLGPPVGEVALDE